MRCAAIINGGDAEVGCGWTGSAIAVIEYGMVSRNIEGCPSCGGPVREVGLDETTE